jgi:hypothetical protein
MKSTGTTRRGPEEDGIGQIETGFVVRYGEVIKIQDEAAVVI